MKYAYKFSRSVLARWFLFVLAGCSPLPVNATTDSVQVSFCVATNEATTLTYNIHVVFTIDPSQVSPPDNVIDQFCSTPNNVSSPVTLCGTELGGAFGTTAIYYSTNGGTTYYLAGMSTIGVAVGPIALPGYCTAPATNIYCTTPKVCNSGLYTRQYHFRSDASGGFSGTMNISPPLRPGECFTFPQVCTDDKSKLHMTYSDFQQSDDGTGFVLKSQGGLDGADLGGWSTNSSIPTPTGNASVTNNIAPTTPTFVAGAPGNTNITFGGSTNPATDGTAKSGFDALYKATVDGFESTKSVLNQGFGSVNSNLYAQRLLTISGTSTLSNLLTGHSGQFSGLSNQLHGISNGIAGIISERNSNNIFATRQNTSNTVELLRDVTNKMAQATNSGIGSAEALSWTTMGTTAAQATKDSFDGYSSTMGPSFDSMPTDIGNWNIVVGGNTIDFNPVTNVHFSGVWDQIHRLLLWIATIGYMAFICREAKVAMFAAAASRQATSAASTPVASTGVALIMAGAITVAIGAIPALLFTTLETGALFGIFSSNPFSGASGSVANGLALLNAMIPVGAIMGYAASAVLFHLSLAGVFWVASTIARFLVGCFIVWAGVQACDAQNYGLTVQNSASIPVYVHPPWEMEMVCTVQPGQIWTPPIPITAGSEIQFSFYPSPGGFADTNVNFAIPEDPDGVQWFVIGQSFSAGPYEISETVTRRNIKTDWDWMLAGLKWSVVPITFAFGMWAVRRVFGGGAETL